MLTGTDAAFEQGLVKLLKEAHIEFILKPAPTHMGDRVTDTLWLDFSEEMADPPFDPETGKPIREKLAEGLLGMVGMKRDVYRQDIHYTPIEKLKEINPEQHFCRSHEDGKLYIAQMPEVQSAIRDMFKAVDSIVNHPLSLCLRVSVDGLDYFNHLQVRRQGHLYQVERENIVPEPTFYNTNYEETHFIRHWLEAIGRPKN